MGCKRTDCIEKPLTLLFEKLGRVVGSYPVPFLVIPLLLSFFLGGGFYYMEGVTDNDIEYQFTPIQGPSKAAREFVRENFPFNESSFSGERIHTEGHYASIIAVGSHGANILTKEAFQEIIDLDKKVHGITVEVDEKKLNFSTMCAKTSGGCVSNDLLEIINYNSSNIELMDITFPLYTSASHKIFLGFAVGGVKDTVGGTLKYARSVKLMYFLDNQEANKPWLTKFKRILQNMEARENIEVSFFTSLSREEEIEQHTVDGVPLFATTYVLVIVFSVLSCLRRDNVRNKVWVAAIGVLSALLAVISSFGLMFYAGIPFVMTVANSPFLILGIGVDDMFIMVSNWQNTNVKDPVPTRMAHTYREAAMSITITTLTDVLAFYIGLISDFRSVMYFCLYTSTAIIFCYIYNITFFGAFLALNGRREASNRHWFTCLQVPDESPADSSDAYRMCCVGGGFDEVTGTEKDKPVNQFFKNYYGPFLTKPWAKCFVLLLYGGYLAGGIYGCLYVQQGVDQQHLAADDSYVIKYYDNNVDYFSDYGPNVMVIVTEKFPYWDKDKRAELHSCMENYKRLPFIDETLYTSWLDSYEAYGKSTHLDLNTKDVFMANLFLFFNVAPVFRQDVNVTDDIIYASRFFIQTIHIANSSQVLTMVDKLNEATENCTAVPLMVYNPTFIYYDQYAVIVSGTAQNIGVSAAVMLLISLLLIPSPLCSLWVTFSIASVIVGITGYMTLWSVNLNSISMIILVACIGFTVDFSAHMSYSYVSSKKTDANEKLIDALAILGYPILQGAMSTIIGVVVLASSKNHIFRTFFKIIFLVMVFGLLHGIAFIPVFLTLFSCKSDRKDEQKCQVETLPSSTTEEKKLSYVFVTYSNQGFEADPHCERDKRVARQQSRVYVIQRQVQTTNPLSAPDCP